MWWHDDYANVDWNKRLTNDMHICIYFITQANNAEVNKFELNENIDKFSEKINKYPQDKLEFLINGTRNYIEYSNSISIDLLNAIKEYSETGYFDWKQSEKTRQLEKTLTNYKLEEDIEFVKKTLEDVNRQLKENFQNDILLIDYEKIKDIETTINLTMEFQQKEYRRIFKSMFNEEL